MVRIRMQYIIFLLAFIDSSLSLKSYDGAQLLRLNSLNVAEDKNFLNTLKNEYGGSIWKSSFNHIDISFEEEYLDEVKSYINRCEIKYEILQSNLKSLISYTEDSIAKADPPLNWTSYPRFSTIVNYLNSLPKKYPNIARILEVGTTVENRKLLVLRITNNIKNDAIFIDGGIHAREWIASASVTYIINYLLTNWNSLPAKLKNKTWYILPMANPDGYEYTHTADRLWRKNRKTFPNQKCLGVDLNRNFDIDWNSSSQSSDPCSEVFKGPAAFSERESTAIRNFLTINRNTVKAYVTYHSYSQLILWPYGYTNTTEAPNAPAMKRVSEQAAANIKKITGTSYTPSRLTIFGLTAGNTVDWIKRNLNTPYTIGVELRDTGNFGFLLPPNQIIGTATEALEVVRVIANAI